MSRDWAPYLGPVSDRELRWAQAHLAHANNADDLFKDYKCETNGCRNFGVRG